MHLAIHCMIKPIYFILAATTGLAFDHSLPLRQLCLVINEIGQLKLAAL